MKKLKKILTGRWPLLMGVPILCLALVAGCGRGEDEHRDDEHAGHAGEDGHDERGSVRLPAERVAELGLEVATAGPGELVLHLALSGEVRLNQDRVAHIVPRTTGIVREVMKTVGDDVEEGTDLALIESTALGEAKVAYMAGRQRLELAETDLARMERIHQNTLAMLDLLDTEPSLGELRKFKGEEMGENRSRLVGAYSEYVVSRATWEREKRLFERKIASESDYFAAENAYKKAEAEYIATRDSIRFSLSRDLLASRRDRQLAEFSVQSSDRQLHVLGLSDPEIETLSEGSTGHQKLAFYALRAPFRGTVVDKHITLGEMLEPADSAFTVADLSTVWVDLTVYQKDLDRVVAGQTVHVGGAGEEVEATVTYVSPVVDEATRTAIARVVLENKDRRWRPGTFVTASLEYEREEARIIVPKTAVQTMGGESVIFVSTDEGFEPRDVHIGRRNKVSVEIEEGLAPGERYVSRGAFVLKAELQKGSFGDGHGH